MGMVLKTYQQGVINDLSMFMDVLNEFGSIDLSWRNYWKNKDISVGQLGVPPYQNNIVGVPHICMKVPTGGGKTFLACCALKRIFDRMPFDKEKFVVWLVPSDSILTQTIRTLSDPSHPYRQRLDMDFGGRVVVYTKDQLLNGQNFSPDTVKENLSICVMSYSSLRITDLKKDERKVYKENGNLLRFVDLFDDKNILKANTPDTALIQVLRYLSPITIVDESHNAASELSVAMLTNLNPSFVLDLTATPKPDSNIISYVDARELKKENMVKLPIIVYQRNNRTSVINDAIQLRGAIEKQALDEEAKNGTYIRPIVLFQAQPNIKGSENETYKKIKDMLIDIGIPEDEIGVKTSEEDTIKREDLMSRDCKIRYIITVNALKEGWDCPFAYILASLANKTSSVDVEQIVGRVLRQPYTKPLSGHLLNSSYVLTCSNNFRDTLDSIVLGLNNAGFSKKDCRYGYYSEEDSSSSETEKSTGTQMEFDFSSVSATQHDETPSPVCADDKEDDFSDVNPEIIRGNISSNTTDNNENPDIAAMVSEAKEQSEKYAGEAASSSELGYIGGKLGEMLRQNRIQDNYRENANSLCIPQFVLESVPDLFGDEFVLLEKENLSDGFLLEGQDAQVRFDFNTGDVYKVDLSEQGESIPKYMRTNKKDADFLRDYLQRIPAEKRIEVCIDSVTNLINKNNQYLTEDVYAYVRRIVGNMKEDELSVMETSLPFYAKKIKDKIESLENLYRERKFYEWLDSEKIVCKATYHFPKIITPANTIDSIPYSLYESEKNDMNVTEMKVLDMIAALDNVLWWHRIIDRGENEFRINGFINHYPDFIVQTKNGKTVLIEVKGDYLDGTDSRTKLKLGRKWASLAGPSYKYFMVFEKKELNDDGAYTIETIVDVLKQL